MFTSIILFSCYFFFNSIIPSISIIIYPIYFYAKSKYNGDRSQLWQKLF